MENNRYLRECTTVQELREQNRLLKELDLCRICKDRKVNRLLLSCAHLSTCNLCVLAIKNCNKCNKPIQGIVSVYR